MYVLRQAEGGTAVGDFCLSLGDLLGHLLYLEEKNTGGFARLRFGAYANWKMKMQGSNGS